MSYYVDPGGQYQYYNYPWYQFEGTPETEATEPPTADPEVTTDQYYDYPPYDDTVVEFDGVVDPVVTEVTEKPAAIPAPIDVTPSVPGKRTSPNTRSRARKLIGLTGAALVLFFPLGIPALIMALRALKTTYDVDAKRHVKTGTGLGVAGIVVGVIFWFLCATGMCISVLSYISSSME